MKSRRRLIVTVIGTTAAMMALATAGVGVATTFAGDSGSSFAKLAKQTHPMTPAAKREIALLRHADLSTRAGAIRYLVARGINPRHVLIQLGKKNYAGPKCPGRGWTCTTSRHVLQAGAVNAASCSTSPARGTDTITASPGSCLIIQSGGGTATCTQTMGSSSPTASADQTCDITQDSSTADNRAVVFQTILQGSSSSSGNQSGTQRTFVFQTNAGGNNLSNVVQAVGQSLGRGSSLSDDNDNDADDFTAATSSSISQIQEAHQSLSVIQSSLTGRNTSNAGQIQGQRERADHASPITQHQNTQDVVNDCPHRSYLDDPFANACATVQQDAPAGVNNSLLGQSYNQLQAASNTTSGEQVQGSSSGGGGIDHTFTQNTTPVTGPAAIQNSRQVERQIQRRFRTGTMTAAHYGPVRKGTGDQIGGTGNSATQKQFSTQFSTGGLAGTQTDVVVDVCSSPTGNCTVHQEVNQNGQITPNDASGPFVDEAIVCGDVGIAPPPPPTTTGDFRWSSASRAMAGTCAPVHDPFGG